MPSQQPLPRPDLKIGFSRMEFFRQNKRFYSYESLESEVETGLDWAPLVKLQSVS